MGLMLSFLYLWSLFSQAQDNHSRKYIDLNKEWSFHFAFDVRRDGPAQSVTLPHTWNAKDVFDNAIAIDYSRTTGIYKRKIVADTSWRGKRAFLYFEGANSVADVFVNNRFVTQHQGGYTAFCVEITDKLLFDKENDLTVYVSNAYRIDVLPLSGDFNVYGGLHRRVSMIITNKNCITPLDFASPGIYLATSHVSDSSGTVNILTRLSLRDKTDNISVKTTVHDATGKPVGQTESRLSSRTDSAINQTVVIKPPHLWNGRMDPYLYSVSVQLLENGRPVDEVIQPLGFRYFRVDADSGFSLNGKPLDLHGFGYHEDMAGKGSALSKNDLEKDMSYVLDAGATAMRLTHYPHSTYFYDLADRKGIILWSEIPLVGPGGYSGTGYVNNPLLKQQARQVLEEMIHQYYNHPSILFWGLFNELKLDYDDPLEFIEELNKLAKQEDPSRLTTCASMLDNDHFNEVTDLIAWNKYYGWYGGAFSEIGNWADRTHLRMRGKPIAISEYGAGGSVRQHVDTPVAPDPGSKFHPEEWQTLYHERNWEELKRRPFIWGKFVWALNDFGSSIRKEGDTAGINDKGLITYDRKICKDAFFFYKANWNPEPMVYIAEKRNRLRDHEYISVKVYTNMPEAELFVNGKSYGKLVKDTLGRVIWKDVHLLPGNNQVSVRSTKGQLSLTDSCTLRFDNKNAKLLTSMTTTK